MNIELSGIAKFITDIMIALMNFWILAIAIGIVVIAGIYIFVVDRRYPKIKFLVYDKGAFIETERRLLINMVVKAGILDLVFFANKLFGPRIEDFDYIRKGNQKIYLAKMGPGNTLIPLKINEQRHSLDEISAQSSKILAMEYINAMDEVKERLEKANPFWTALIGTLPLAIVLILVFALFWAFTSYVIQTQEKLLGPYTAQMENINTTAMLLNQTASTLERISMKINASG